MKLVLFDIDGTVLLSDGAGKRAVRRALTEIYGSAGPENHRFDGKTDPQIIRELMQHEGHDEWHIDGHMNRTLGRYVELLAEELDQPSHRAYVLPGVLDLLAALHERDDVIVGLLTGNVVEGARAKLKAVGVDPDQFVVGAFGSDHEIRSELPAIAKKRTLEMLGHDVNGPQIVIIGDTPSDVRCGQSVGARAIGVGTGHYSAKDLMDVGAYAAFDDLSDTDAVVAAIVAP